MPQLILSGKADIAPSTCWTSLGFSCRLAKAARYARPDSEVVCRQRVHCARDRPRNADELGAHFIHAEPNRRA